MIFIQIRCVNRNEDNPDCLSHSNSDEYEYSYDTQQDLIHSYRILKKRAIESGYKKLKGQWICPSCVEHIGLK